MSTAWNVRTNGNGTGPTSGVRSIENAESPLLAGGVTLWSVNVTIGFQSANAGPAVEQRLRGGVLAVGREEVGRDQEARIVDPEDVDEEVRVPRAMPNASVL